MTKKIKLKNVPYTIVSTYFGREHSGSQAETWKVSLRAEPRSVNAYIKLTNNYRQTIAELLTTMLMWKTSPSSFKKELIIR
ncbi:hypothetical protein BTO01_01960 [Vibrio jasicida]|nr:hypothetical protein BTO01_01960 [Vibrio jasicida]